MTKDLTKVVNAKLVGEIMLVMVMLLFTLQASAQKVTPSMSDGGGYHFVQDGIYIDMSVGELAISTLTTTSQVITQGFLQPISIEQPCATPELIYYPNPVVDIITLGAIDCDVYVDYVEGFDLFGKLVLETVAQGNVVDLTTIGVGVYFLRVYSEAGQLIGTVKIVKITA